MISPNKIKAFKRVLKHLSSLEIQPEMVPFRKRVKPNSSRYIPSSSIVNSDARSILFFITSPRAHQSMFMGISGVLKWLKEVPFRTDPFFLYVPGSHRGS